MDTSPHPTLQDSKLLLPVTQRIVTKHWNICALQNRKTERT